MTTDNNSDTRKPSHRLYVVKGDGKEALWIEVGAAWPNRDGGGFTLSLNRIVMRTIDDNGGQQ